MNEGFNHEYRQDEYPPAQGRVRNQPLPRQRVAPGPIMTAKSAGFIVVFGVLLFFIGSMLSQSVVFMYANEPDDYDDYDDYQNAIVQRYGMGKMLNWAGAMIIAIPLFLFGMTNEFLDWKVRATMITTGTALVISAMVVSIFNSFPWFGF